MVRFQVLGSLDLHGKDGEELRSVLVQPKRLALLAYLVLAKPVGFQRRDALVALFWPEADGDRARLALRQALHFLRRSLGDGVIVARGDEEVRIAVEALWCDATAFESALDKGRLLEALELYRGELLAGFFVTDVSAEVEQWLDAERARLRARAAAAAWALSNDAERDGNLKASTDWARRALQLAADDEAGLRRLITLLSRGGDRAGALREHDEFARRLKEQFQVEPSSETRDLADGIRQGRDERRAVTPPAANASDRPRVADPSDRSISATALPVASPATSVGKSPSSVSAPRLRGWLVASGAALLAITLGIRSLMPRSSNSPAALLAVGSIANEAGASFDETARRLPGLIATDLARVSGLAVVSQTRLLELLGQGGQREETPPALAAAARRAGATEIVEGALYRRDNQLRLDLRRVDLARGVLKQAYSTSGTDAFELADRVTSDIARGFSLTPPATPLSTTGTGSLVARRFYEEGLRAYYRGEWRAALRLFSAALAEDSTFAMAAYYAAQSIAPFRTDSLYILMMRAHRLADRAPERERLIIKFGGDPMNIGDPRHSEYRLRAAVAESLALRYPNEPDGPLAMATMRIRAGDFVGALPYARRVIAMDSLSLQGRTPACRACDAFSKLLAAYAAMGSDSFPAVERVAREWIRLQPKAASAWLMLAKALSWRGRSDEALEALNMATQLEPRPATFYEHPSSMPAALFESAVIQDENYAEAERMLRDRSRFNERDQEAIWWLVTSLRHQGRVSESLALAEQTKGFRVAEGRTPDPWEYVLGTLLFELGRFRESARRFEALMHVRHNDPSDPGYTSRYGVQAATAWAAAGDTQRLPALADSIERAARKSQFGLDWHFPHHVRGLLWQARGQLDRALAEFQAAIWSPTLGYTRTNLELARTFLSLGRPHDATRIFREALGGSSDGPDYFVTRTEVHEWLARSFEAAGQRDSAVVHYRKVAEAWKNGDAPYRARAEAARHKLDELAR